MLENLGDVGGAEAVMLDALLSRSTVKLENTQIGFTHAKIYLIKEERAFPKLRVRKL